MRTRSLRKTSRRVAIGTGGPKLYVSPIKGRRPPLALQLGPEHSPERSVGGGSSLGVSVGGGDADEDDDESVEDTRSVAELSGIF